MFVLAACGGSSTSGSDVTTAATTAKAATTDTSSEVTTAGSDTTVAADFSGKGSGDICGMAREYEKSSNLDNIFQSADPTQMKKDLELTRKAMDDMTKTAPAEIKADVQKVTGAVLGMLDVLTKYNFDFVAMSKAIETDPAVKSLIGGGLESEGFEAASSRVEQYFEKVCGIKS